MNRTRTHLIHAALLAGLSLGASGVAASTAAAAPTISLGGGVLGYSAGGDDMPDELSFDPGVVNGVAVIDIRSNRVMTRSASAAAICSDSATTIRCTVTGVNGLHALTGGGDDTIEALAATGAEPELPLHADGADGGDVLYGGEADDFLNGGPGADTVHGGDGGDTIVGGLGEDTLYTDGGDDAAWGDVFESGSGGPPPTNAFAGPGDGAASLDDDQDEDAGGEDLLFGGAGADELHGQAGTDTLLGQDGDDAIDGGEGADAISGGAAADALDGGEGNDDTAGGDGDDELLGDRGSDRLAGGSGVDTVSYADRPDPLSVTLDEATAATDGGPLDDPDGAGPGTARDVLLGIEVLYGGDAGDVLRAGAAAAQLHGGPGADELVGSDAAGGVDLLAGDGGDDRLTGGAGLDVHFGGAGDDELHTADGVAEPNLDCGDGTADVLDGDATDGRARCETIRGPAAPPVDPGTPPQAGGQPGGQGPAGPGGGQQGAADPPAGGSSPARVRVAVDARLVRAGGRWRVARLRLRSLPTGARAVLSCSARRRGACPFRRVSATAGARARGTLDLGARLRSARLRSGAVLELRVTHAGHVGLVRRYALRAGARRPAVRTLCLPAGSAAPARCAA